MKLISSASTVSPTRMARTIAPSPNYLTRHSRAAQMSAREGGSVRTILIAFVANVVVALAKFVAGLVSGSAALLGEAGHSLADCLNETFLGYSLVRGRRPDDEQHPFGHGRERFLWAFLAAIASFLIGGCLSVGLAIREFVSGGTTGDFRLAWIVIGISFLADGTSWLQGVRHAQREAARQQVSVRRFLLTTSEPSLRAVVVEDSAALIGLTLASLGLLLSTHFRTETPDAVAALLIGILLALTATGLARLLGDFLVGRSLAEADMRRLSDILAASPAVEQILQLRAVYIGPEDAVVAAKVHPAPHLTTAQLSEAMDQIDAAMRAAIPEVADVYLDISAYSLDTLPLDRDHGYLDT
jgi:cation diffusion facilitator family transporter